MGKQTAFITPTPTPVCERCVMPPAPTGSAESRQAPRLKLAPMYTLLRAKKAGTQKYRWSGYIYDISMSGMRFELDQALEPGTTLEVRATLPYSRHGAFVATGQVVRIHDDVEESPSGPYRMAMHFTSFRCDVDEAHLADYLSNSGLRLAA